MIRVSLRMIPPKETRQQVLSALKAVVEPTRAGTGCLRCNLYEEISDERAFVLVQEWACREELDNYLRSRKFLRILGLLESSREEPDVRFDVIEKSFGMELVFAARGPGQESNSG